MFTPRVTVFRAPAATARNSFGRFQIAPPSEGWSSQYSVRLHRFRVRHVQLAPLKPQEAPGIQLQQTSPDKDGRRAYAVNACEAFWRVGAKPNMSPSTHVSLVL